MTINKEQAVSDAMIEAGAKAFGLLDSPRVSDIVTTIYLAMQAASHQQQAVSGDVVERADFLDLMKQTRQDLMQELPNGVGNQIDWAVEEIERLRAALTASGVERMREALEKIAAGSKLGTEMFEQRVNDRKGRLTWWAVNVLQDNLAACEGTARTALQGGE